MSRLLSVIFLNVEVDIILQVGIVSQLETAAEKKANSEKSSSSIFDRNVTSIYTAATLIGDDIRLDDVDKDAPSGTPQTIVALLNDKNVGQVNNSTSKPYMIPGGGDA